MKHRFTQWAPLAATVFAAFAVFASSPRKSTAQTSSGCTFFAEIECVPREYICEGGLGGRCYIAQRNRPILSFTDPDGGKLFPKRAATD